MHTTANITSAKQPQPAKTAPAPNEENGESNEIECGCCFTEYPPEEVTRCYAGHTFCLQCAKMNAESEIGKSRYVLRCMDTTSNCKEEFPRREVLRFVDKNTLGAIDKIKLDVVLPEVQGVDGLVERCPFCEYVVICGTVEEMPEIQCTSQTCIDPNTFSD